MIFRKLSFYYQIKQIEFCVNVLKTFKIFSMDALLNVKNI